MPSTQSTLPILAVTPGEPAGIGPDIALLITPPRDARIVLVADPELLRRRAHDLATNADYPEWNDQSAAGIYILPVPLRRPVQDGQLDNGNVDYVLECLDTAIDACLAGSFQGLVTGPVNKAVINDAGHEFTGHTEYLARRAGVERVVMMLATETLRVALATTHLPLSAVPSAINQEMLGKTLAIIDRDLRNRFGIPKPRIAVCGLNPHAGESGHLGREEIEIIIPALESARNTGLDVLGPLPADTAFTPTALEQCDVVLAMYHDQGLPVLKHAGFGKAVNITLGLPFVRTSVDHGTALELAGSGRASADSLNEAVHTALSMIER